MTHPHYDVIIVGGGAIGAATLHFLAQKGVTQSLLIEQSSTFASGTSGVWGSLVRQYGQHPLYSCFSPLANRYYLEEFLPSTGYDPHFKKTGSLYFLDPHHAPLFEKTLEKIKMANIYPIEVFDMATLHSRFPDFQLFDGELAIYEPNAGVFCPTAVATGWIESAKRMGAQAKIKTKVTGFKKTHNKISAVLTDKGEVLSCDLLILAAGPWAITLLKDLGLQLPIILHSIQINHLQYQHSYAKEQALPFFIDASEDTFARPLNGEGEFLGGYLYNEKAGGPPFRRHLQLKNAIDAKKRLSKRLKCLRNSTLIGGVRALETYTLNNHPIMEFSTQYHNLFVATGWCCTGLTLAPIWAQKIAQKIVEHSSHQKRLYKKVVGVELWPHQL